MNFEPINISFNDLRRYTEIAYIVDRPSIIKEAKKIRKKYNITKPMRDDGIQYWTLKNIPRKRIPELFKDIVDMRMYFGYDSNYSDVFERTVFGGDISDDDYQSTILVNFVNLPPFIKYEKVPLYGIVLTSQTDKKDVVKAFDRYKQIERNFQLSEDTYSSTDERIDEQTEIKRNRNWYWKRQHKISYWQIAQSEGVSRDNFNDYHKDRIAKAVKSYKQKLEIV